jgi:transcriptional regulator with XRE-family HTH domain
MSDKRKKLPRRKVAAELIPAVQLFRANVRILLERAKDGEKSATQAAIAEKSGIPLRTLTHQLSLEPGGASAPTLRTVQAVADALRMPPWLLLHEDFPSVIALDPHVQRQIQKTLKLYFGAVPESRSAVDATAELLPQRSKSVP